MLITEQYRAEQAALHAQGSYGTVGARFGMTVAELLISTGARSVLDYGCGSRRSLLEGLQLPEEIVYEGYDPAVPVYSAPPLPAELVVCIDVLEHIEPALLDNVLDHLGSLCDPYGLFTVHSAPALKTLSDGRNAHLTQQGPDWWLPRFEQRFEVLQVEPIPMGFVVLVRSRGSDTALRSPSRLKLPPVPTKAAPEPAAPIAAGVPRTVLKYLGHRIAFRTPTEALETLVKSSFREEAATIRWVEQLEPGSVLVDIGAGMGLQTLLAGVVRGARVFAFEPDDERRALLDANIADNGLAASAAASASSLAPPHATLDQLVERGDVPVPRYVRVHAGSASYAVLFGARRTLAEPTVEGLIVALDLKLPSHAAAVELLESLGFSHDPRRIEPLPEEAGGANEFAELVFSRAAPGASGFALQRSVTIAIPRSAKARRVLNHVLDRIGRAEITDTPFPHLVVDEVFPADYYAEMLAHFPAPASMQPLDASGRTYGMGYAERNVVLFSDDDFARLSSGQRQFWLDLAEWMYSPRFVQAFVQKFAAALEPRLDRIFDAEGALTTRCDALLVNDRTRYAIGPHTDAPHRLISFLFYLPRDASMRELGTSLYRPKDPDFGCWGGPHHGFEAFDRVATLDFLPNRLLAFPKTERSFHGVEAIQREGVNRPLLISNVQVLNRTTH